MNENLILAPIYLLLILLPLLLPEHFILEASKRIYRCLKALKPSSEFARGEKLLDEFSHWEMELSKGKIPVKESSLPKYKFFSSLVTSLLFHCVKLGTPLRKPLRNIRGALSKDLEYEKVIQEFFWGGIVQFVATGVMTWGFIHFSLQVLKLNFPKWCYLLIGALQIIGMLFYIVGFFRLRRKALLSLEQLLGVLYSLESLSNAGLCVQKVVETSGILTLQEVGYRGKSFKRVISRTFQLISKWREVGQCPGHELGELLENLWFELRLSQNRFKKLLEGAKFLIMAVFFLGSYLLYLYLLVSELSHSF